MREYFSKRYAQIISITGNLARPPDQPPLIARLATIPHATTALTIAPAQSSLPSPSHAPVTPAPFLPLLNLLAALALCIAALPSNANIEVTNPARQLEVTLIKGHALPFILGENTQAYSLMAVIEGQLAAIPFQFDDINLKGLTFVPGAKIPVDGTENVLDPQDELVFMYKDMAEKLAPDQFRDLQDQIISEFEITEDGVSRYAYLVKGNSERSTKVYSHYNFETGYLETESYSLQFNPKNILLWSDWKIKDFEGTQSAPNILDTMKARLHARLGFMKATLHNRLLPVSMIGVKNGPVRSIVEGDVSLGLFGYDILSAGVSVTFTAQTIEYPIFAFLPKAADAFSEFSIDVTLDYVDLEGSRYRTALGPKEPLITGQPVSEQVRAQYTTDMDNPWLAISTGKNWDMFFVFTAPEGFNPTLKALYRDSAAGDKPNKPERYKGSNSELGVNLSDLPVGIETILNYSLYFGPDLWQGNNPEKAAFDILNPAQVTIKQNFLAIN
ncbi:MAG: hypothetical protein COB04_08150 [Gammaproteobacteria bacterium]|nr:MAG: hypothetical protein COB04_08150 [Gammaproteobacteria bacterium]